jgi:hypothetical protein
VLIPGISYDGGYQQYMVAPIEALAAIPASLSDVEAAPLLCAGITTFIALRHQRRYPSDPGCGAGYRRVGAPRNFNSANKFGYKVAAIGRGSENAALAKKLGASVYIDSKATDAAKELQKMGGAQVIFGDRSQLQSDVPSSSTAWDQTASLWWWERPSIPSKSRRYSSFLEAKRFKAGPPGRQPTSEGHDALRRIKRRACDGRNLSARKSRGSLRPYDERPGAVYRVVLTM